MRQSQILHAYFGFPLEDRSLLVVATPAGIRIFPSLSLKIFTRMPEPLPRLLLQCFQPFLPVEHWPSPTIHWVGAKHQSLQQLPKGDDFGAAVFVKAFQPPGLLAILTVPTLYYFKVIQAAMAFTSGHTMVSYLPIFRIC